MSVTRRIVLALAIVLAACITALPRAEAGEPVRVFAAASLKEALDQINAAWRSTTPGAAVSAAYAASSTLAKQIEQGAPADVFISADLDWMDYLGTRQRLKPGTRKSLLGNTLVLIAPAGSGLKIDLKAGADVSAALGNGKLAMADVASVPAGKYGKAALENLGLWRQVETQVAASENVRAALLFVARGEARLGIVYGSDAKAEPKVDVVGIFPAGSHPPVAYPVALVAGANNPAAAAYLAFLSSPTAHDIFIAKGFTILP